MSSSSSDAGSALRCGGRGGARKLLGFGGGSGTDGRPPGTGGRKLFALEVGELEGSPGASDRFGGGGALLSGAADAMGFEPVGAGAFDAAGFEGAGATLVEGSAGGGSVSFDGRDGGTVDRPPSGRGGLAFLGLFGSSAMLFSRRLREQAG
ncbi:MAG: hypothetical protein ACOY0T_10680 [Myxococcota bacterium]